MVFIDFLRYFLNETIEHFIIFESLSVKVHMEEYKIGVVKVIRIDHGRKFDNEIFVNFQLQRNLLSF